MRKTFSLDFITIRDLYSAYKKAKYEAFRTLNCAQGLKFAAYEQRLEFNLSVLLTKICAPNTSWFNNHRFLGRATCIPKSITPRPHTGSHFTLSDPTKEWKRLHRKEKAETEFRAVIDASIDFQIISALWIMKVGQDYDACLDTRVAVGNRLRRWRAQKGTGKDSVGAFNEKSLSLFRPYYPAYGAWRENGLNAMKEGLSKGKHIVAVTMDLKRFYHQVDPQFLLEEKFLKAAGIVIDSDQKLLTKQLIAAIETWNTHATRLTGQTQYGLPVGLTASGVIANSLLKEFDTGMQNLEPAYYGRYVDDIFLVLEHKGFTDSNELMQWLAKQLGSIASYFEDKDGSPILRLQLPYGRRSQLLFMGKKQKVFQLEGQHGVDLINPIEEQIRKQKSEHQGLPDLPDREAEMAARALLVSPDATLDADALRKADAVTLRRAGFAMLLTAIEQHAAHVDNKSWGKQRRQFYGLAQRHLLTPRGFFDYSSYFPRIIGVMVTCGDKNRAILYIRALARLVGVIRATCEYNPRELDEYCRTLGDRIVESILQSKSVELRGAPVLPLIKILKKRLAPTLVGLHTEAGIRQKSKSLFFADWSRRPYGVTWLEAHAPATKIPPSPKEREVRKLLNIEAIETLRTASQVSIAPYWPALAFPTRPISVADITAYAPSLLEDYDSLKTVIGTIRGTWSAKLSSLKIERGSTHAPAFATIPIKGKRRPIRVAVTNFRTTDEEWIAAVKKTPTLTLDRYRRINRFINEILRRREKVSHVLFPECSIPRRWARNILTKLSIQGISFIGGLEYAHTLDGLRNEAVVSLVSDFPGYRTNVVILQPKLSPAWKEHKTLLQLTRKSLIDTKSRALALPVYAHGRLNFAVLICSDLTTLANRNLLQGHIDCLFVPEWNQDLDTFGTLIESASSDLHAYLVQSNNRLYGDSRIRAPYKKNFKRDVVRIRGGLHDYFVIDELDIQSLRDFQLKQPPPDGDKELFKPFPVGFRMAKARQT